jgi:DNA replication protein DnaC
MEKPMLSLVKTAMEEIEASRTTARVSDGRLCCSCGKWFPLPSDSPHWRELDYKCGTCRDTQELRLKSDEAEQKECKRNAILAQIPSAFRATVRERLPQPEKMDAALNWQFGSLGLLLFGPTGCGKSRVAWEVAKREVLAGKSLKCVNAFELSRYPSLFMADATSAGAFADSLVNVDLLMLDDVFKAKPTERVEELLFAVIDERGQWEKPCIITLNDTGDTLTARLSADRGPALIRRLRDYCQTINF